MGRALRYLVHQLVSSARPQLSLWCVIQCLCWGCAVCPGQELIVSSHQWRSLIPCCFEGGNRRNTKRCAGMTGHVHDYWSCVFWSSYRQWFSIGMINFLYRWIVRVQISITRFFSFLWFEGWSLMKSADYAAYQRLSVLCIANPNKMKEKYPLSAFLLQQQHSKHILSTASWKVLSWIKVLVGFCLSYWGGSWEGKKPSLPNRLSISYLTAPW